MLQPGDRIGRYEIQRRLGRGGMGTVYVAHDPVLGRLVALKMFASDLDAADAAEKFMREARAAAALNHTNIVTIHDFGEFDSQPFIVMEYIQGDTLARIIRKKSELSLSDRLHLIEDLCAGVAYAHGFEVIHRDIKPANLMVDRANRLKVLDFGIARMVGTSLSKGTALIGTPGYMAPEQIRGGTIDRRSDLFSIGVVTYELLSYVEAFPGDSVPAITHRILTDDPLPLTQLVEDMPDELVAVVERALKKNPADRYPDATAMGAAIAQVRRQVDGDPRFATIRPTLQGVQSPSRPSSGTGRSSNVTPGPLSPLVTPSSDSGRQAQLARKRTEQIERALTKARAELQEGRLPDARESCLEALSLSETHPGALQLEKEIDAALGQQRVRDLVAEGRTALERGALTQVESTVRQLRELDSPSIDVRQLERDLRIKRAERAEADALAESVRQALQRARTALEHLDLEAALTAARQARRLDPSSEEARRLEAEALRQMDLETGVGETIAGLATTTDIPTVAVPGAASLGQPAAQDRADARTVVSPAFKAPVTPPQAPRAEAAVPTKPVIVRKQEPSGASVALARFWAATQTRALRAGGVLTAFATVTAPQAFRSAGRATSQAMAQVAPGSKGFGGRTAIIAWSSGSLILIAAIAGGAFVYLKPPPVAPVVTGIATIDAMPWATVTSIIGPDGQRHALPDDASTPLTIVLPVGSYQVMLTGPQPDAAPIERTVTVVDGQTVRLEDVRFPSLSAESYFESYLVSHEEPPAPESAGSESVRPVTAKAPEEAR